MYLADMHCDSLLKVTSENGLLTNYNISKKHPKLQFFAHFVPCNNEPAEVRRKRLMHLLDIYISECQRLGLVMLKSCHDLNFAIEFEKSSALLSIEGGGGLFADSAELETLYLAGLRVLSLAWDTNELASSCYDKNDTGLTDKGRALVLRASEMGIILDLSHLSDRSAEEALELSSYPPLATHSNFRDICASPRNLTFNLAKKITARGGVIGLNLYPPFLKEGGNAGPSDILRHVDYALEHFGEDSIGFGFDIDGTDGEYPCTFSEKESIYDRALELLFKHYSASSVEKIAGKNVIDFCKNNL